MHLQRHQVHKLQTFLFVQLIQILERLVPDEKLEKLAKIASSKIIIPTKMTFVDIAGLVKGASRGEGLGNNF